MKKKQSNIAILKSVDKELQTAYMVAVWCGFGFAMFFCLYLQPMIGEMLSHVIIIIAGVVAVVATLLLIFVKRKY